MKPVRGDAIRQSRETFRKLFALAVPAAFGLLAATSANAQIEPPPEYVEAVDNSSVNGGIFGVAVFPTCATGANGRSSNPNNQAFQQDCNLLVGGSIQDTDGVSNAFLELAADQINGENSVPVRRSAGNVAILSGRLARVRLASGMAAFSGDTALAANNPFAGQQGGGASSDSQFGRLGTFFNVQYVTGDEDDTAYQPGFDFHGWGFTGGLDYRFNDNFTGGASLNYGDGSSDFNNNRGDLDTNAWGGTLYGTYFTENGLYLNGLLGYSRFDYDMKRRINYSVTGDTANQSAKSSPDSNAFSASLGAGYNFVKDSVTLAPYLRFDYLQNKVDSYSEKMSSPTTTGGSMALNYKSQKYKSFTSNLGLQLARAFSQSFGVVVPQLTLEWVHEFENDQQKAGVQFANDINGTSFFVLTNNPDRNYFDLGLAVSTQLQKGRSAFLSYNTLLGYKDVNYNAINAGVRFEIE